MRSERALKLAIAEMYVKGVKFAGSRYRRNSLWHRSQLVPGQAGWQSELDRLRLEGAACRTDSILGT